MGQTGGRSGREPRNDMSHVSRQSDGAVSPLFRQSHAKPTTISRTQLGSRRSRAWSSSQEASIHLGLDCALIRAFVVDVLKGKGVKAGVCFVPWRVSLPFPCYVPVLSSDLSRQLPRILLSWWLVSLLLHVCLLQICSKPWK